MATSVDQKNFVKTALRLPPDLHEKVHAAAQASGRSYNAELVERIQQSFVVKAGSTLVLQALIEGRMASLHARAESMSVRLEMLNSRLAETKGRLLAAHAQLKELDDSDDLDDQPAKTRATDEVVSLGSEELGLLRERHNLAKERDKIQAEAAAMQELIDEAKATAGQSSSEADFLDSLDAAPANDLTPTVVRLERELAGTEVTLVGRTVALEMMGEALRPFLAALPPDQIVGPLDMKAGSWLHLCNLFKEKADEEVSRAEIDALKERFAKADAEYKGLFSEPWKPRPLLKG